MPRLRLLLLGSPEIEYDDRPVKLDTRKAVALLAYLAVTRQRQGRDKLAALLWPEYEEARGALRRTLSVLNRATHGQYLEVDRESVRLNQTAHLWVDVEHFHSLLAECRNHNHGVDEVCPSCLPLLSEAVALHRDEFLAGFSLRDSPDFDEWQYFEAEGLRRDLVSVLQRLIQGHALGREFEPAITHARRLLTLDPLDEAAHRSLMQLYEWSGQHGAALRQYRECTRELEQNLGVGPLEETTQLY